MPDVHHHDHENHDAAAVEPLVDLLDLDGEVLRTYWTEALDLVEGVTNGSVARVLDLGAGSGVGTIALARRFPVADVLAVDVSAEMLTRIRAKAKALTLTGVRCVQADLDTEWPPFGPLDLTWASMSLHHLADPDAALRTLFAATRPGGVLAAVEFAQPLRFLPDDIGVGRSGLEARSLEILAAEPAHSVPELGRHWAPRFAAAGFSVLAEHPLMIDEPGPLSPAALRYGRLWLTRLRSGVASRLDADDQDALATLLDDGGLETLYRRGGLHIQGTRSVTLARRSPAG
jgi:ubiquinone/menaquinone biosynthesis C-methylase UbiE